MPKTTHNSSFYELDIHTCLSHRTYGSQEREKYHFNLSNYQTLEIIAVKNRLGGYVKMSMKIV